MRVMHVIAAGPLAGAEKVVLTGAAALRERGVDVELVSLEEERAPEHGRRLAQAAAERGIPTRTLRVAGRVDLALVRALRARARGRDVVHAHGHKALAHVMAGFPPPPVVCTWHGSTGHDARVRAYEALAARIAARCDRVVAVGHALVEDLAAAGIDRARIAVIENPVALTALPPVMPRSSRLRLLFAGRLSPEKGLAVLLQALARPEAAQVDVDVAGDGPERAAAEACVERLRLRDRVRFLGWLPSIAPALADVEGLVLPSLREGLPLAVLEAAGAGRLVVASAVGAVPDVIRDGATGVLCPPGDPVALAEALGRAQRARATLLMQARAAAPVLRERFGASRWAARTEALYGELVGGGSRRLGGLR